MNNQLHKEMVKEAVMPKFKGKDALKSKTILRYPDTAEREMKRAINAYLKILTGELKKRLPELIAAYKRGQREDARFDDLRDLEQAVRKVFREIAQTVEQKFASLHLGKMLRATAEMTERNSLREWKRAVKETLGIDLMNSYYDGRFFEEYIRKWVDENVLRITSIPNQTLGEMQQTILEGFRKGKTIRDIQREIQNQYHVTRSTARLIARDQISTLNSQITQAQQRDAGITKYVWSTSHDSRVRECHAELDGKIISWDDPPAMWYNTKSKGTVYTGRRCHPGEDYACRCCALPYFEFDKLDLPIAEGEK